jgi:hypothetical protein
LEFTDWITMSNYIVCLNVNDELDLLKLMDKANQFGITYAEMREEDLGGSLTAVALQPGEVVRQICRFFPLQGRTDREAVTSGVSSGIPDRSISDTPYSRKGEGGSQ